MENSKEKYDLYYYDKETKQLLFVEDHCDQYHEDRNIFFYML